MKFKFGLVSLFLLLNWAGHTQSLFGEYSEFEEELTGAIETRSYKSDENSVIFANLWATTFTDI